MPSELTTALLGLAVVVAGLVLFTLGWSYPVTTCFGVDGATTNCTTDTGDLLLAYSFMGSGVVGTALGGRTLWKVW